VSVRARQLGTLVFVASEELSADLLHGVVRVRDHDPLASS
jgi:hypothetical protein